MSDEKINSDLEIYLRDHFAGGVGALELIDHLCKEHEKEELGSFFLQLQSDVKADHDTLHNVITELGGDVGSVRNAGAWVAEKLGRAKLGFSAGEDAKLRLLQSLESLHIGITGKRLLWRALIEVRESSPVLERLDLDRLEKRAQEQADEVDRKRLQMAPEALQTK